METKTGLGKSEKQPVVFSVTITRVYQRPTNRQYDKVNHGLRAIYRVRQLQLGTIAGSIYTNKAPVVVLQLMHKYKKVRVFDSRTVDGIYDRKTVKDVDSNFRRLPSKFNSLKEKTEKEEEPAEPTVEEKVVQKLDKLADVLHEEIKQFVVKPKPKRRTKKRTKPDEGEGRILTDADLA